ncbi:Mitochondrial import inner membrane translocase subunit Tim16 [Aphelenchoides fujianensis]|nr:Mitochondrial import inner membrane translocase subunit Tim16 [Aphelenchoides fujianensis]
MVIRNVAKIVLAAAEALGKALKKSVQEELNASRAAERTTASAGSSQSQAKDETKANRRHGITLQESMQILDIKALEPEEIEKRFQHLFEINDKNKGGSTYLQQKIKAAKKRVDEEVEKKQSTNG